LIKHETHIEKKKIPYMLEIKDYRQAMSIAVEDGDPNNINRVISAIIKEAIEVD